MGALRRLPSLVVLGLSSWIILQPQNASAQEVHIDEPIRACIALALLDATPANIEWTYWVTGGGGFDSKVPTERFGILGGGMEATTGIFNTGGRYQYGGPYEFRGGPWWNVFSDFQGLRAEGGYAILFGQTSHAQWGTYSVRVGGGAGDDRMGIWPHFVVTLTGGIRSVLGRYTERGACDPVPVPKTIALADTFRLYATARNTFVPGASWQFTFGVEFSPTFFLPPYSLGKWIGARP